MLQVIKGFINSQEINLGDELKNIEFSKSLRGLVTILFAVVFGVGLSELNRFDTVACLKTLDFWLLALAYIAVILSWRGYHFGTIVGPKETNWLNYTIDIFLLVVYWFLINRRTPFESVLFWYSVMFCLYWSWEMIRFFSDSINDFYREKIAKAKRINLEYFIITALLFLFYALLSKTEAVKWIILFFLFFFIIRYRRYIEVAYGAVVEKKDAIYVGISKDIEKRLIIEAKTISNNAQVHLSGFRVGAALLSTSGSIYSGCNVEFDNYSNTIHAEESAISAFVSAGEKRPICVAVYTNNSELSFPCGMCRQSLFELGGKNMKIIACNNDKQDSKMIGELLPSGFHL